MKTNLYFRLVKTWKELNGKESNRPWNFLQTMQITSRRSSCIIKLTSSSSNCAVIHELTNTLICNQTYCKFTIGRKISLPRASWSWRTEKERSRLSSFIAKIIANAFKHFYRVSQLLRHNVFWWSPAFLWMSLFSGFFIRKKLIQKQILFDCIRIYYFCDVSVCSALKIDFAVGIFRLMIENV